MHHAEPHDRAAVSQGRHRALPPRHAAGPPGAYQPQRREGVPRVRHHLVSAGRAPTRVRGADATQRGHARQVPLPHLRCPGRLHAQPRERPAEDALDSRAQGAYGGAGPLAVQLTAHAVRRRVEHEHALQARHPHLHRHRHRRGALDVHPIPVLVRIPRTRDWLPLTITLSRSGISFGLVSSPTRSSRVLSGC